MLNFPEIKGFEEPAVPKMSLRDYAHFSVFCLENNPHITPENCRKDVEKSIGVR